MQISSVSILVGSILTNTFGILLFLFILWKKLKDDFAPEIIFKLGFSIILGIFIGILFSLKISTDFLFWLGFVGAILGIISIVIRYKANFFEVFEAFIISILPWLGFVFLQNSVVRSSFSSFLGFLTILIFIFISYFINTHYKSFNWYKSGKIGFTGLSTLGLIFVLRFVLAMFSINMLSFAGKFEAGLSGVSAFFCFSLLFYLAQTKE